MSTTADRTTVSDERLVERLGLTRDADSVDLKLTVPEASHRSAIQVAAEGRAMLVARGIDLSGRQQTKTRKAFEFFSAELQAAAAAGEA